MSFFTNFKYVQKKSQNIIARALTLMPCHANLNMLSPAALFLIREQLEPMAHVKGIDSRPAVIFPD